MQFLSFSINTTQNYFGQNIVTFDSSKTSQNCQTCANEPKMSWLPQKPPNMICCAVLIVSISKIQKYFCQNLSLLVVPKLSKLVKLANQPKMSWFCPGNPRTGFVVQFLSLPSVRSKNISVKICHF